MSDFDKIKSLLEAGRSPMEIRKELGSPGSTITWVRRKIGMKPFKKGNKLGQIKKSKWRLLRPEILKLKQAGKSYNEIASTFGVSRQMIQRVIAKPQGPGMCPKCNKWFKSRHGHHTDYENEIVVPLCVKCHRAEELK